MGLESGRVVVRAELHPGDPDVVGGGGADGERPRHGGAVGRGADADRRRGRVGVGDGDADGGRGGPVAGGVAGGGGQRVRAVGDSRGVPGDRVGRGRVLGAEAGAFQEELHPGDPNVVGGGGADGERPRHGGAVGRGADADRRRGRVGGGDGDAGVGRGGPVAGGVAGGGGQ